jgi:catechol 2,3-dioxygenase-like lactoylglutathione lyase family enzyme
MKNENKLFKSIHQIGLVVRDAKETAKNFADIYGIMPWNFWEFNSTMVDDMEVWGKKTNYRMIVATCKTMNVDFEIIQPLDHKSTYSEFIVDHGQGIQHINYQTDNYEETKEYLEYKGVKVSQFGNWLGKHRYIYFDTESDTGHVIETSGDLPGFKRAKPMESYPEPDFNKVLSKQIFKRIAQINVIVPDIKKSTSLLNDKYLIGPWEFFKYNSIKIKDRQSNESIDYAFSQAICKLSGVELSLIEPKNERGIFYEFMKFHGHGPNYICFEVEDCNNTIQSLGEKGILITQSGSWHKREYFFVSSGNKLGFSYCFFEPNI